MSPTEIISTSANVATALGVVAVGFQLWLNRRQMIAAFERTFVTRYETIIKDIPLDLLLGASLTVSPSSPSFRPFYDYFELSEEELYFRAAGKVSESTWIDWWVGISTNLSRPAFRSAWDALQPGTPSEGSEPSTGMSQFKLLRRAIDAIDSGRAFDPKD